MARCGRWPRLTLSDNDAVYDGVSRPGARIVTFAPMLKHGTFPLAEILDVLVRAGEEALGNPVEIEFAVRLPQKADPLSGQVAEFGFLQIRPLTLARDSEDLAFDDVRPEELICLSGKVLGNGMHREPLRCCGGRFRPLRTQPQSGSGQGSGPIQSPAQ